MIPAQQKGRAAFPEVTYLVPEPFPHRDRLRAPLARHWHRTSGPAK
jgi:hypothetical protein